MSVTMNLTAAKIRWRGMGDLDRDIMAEKAATLIRKGATLKEVCQELKISRGRLVRLGQEFDFRVPTIENSLWPTADDPGEAGEAYHDPRYEVWSKARRAAAQLRAAMKPPEPEWDAQPPPVFYDHCEPATHAGPLSGAEVIRQVCIKHRVSRDALVGPLRRREICAARHEAAFRMVVELGYSYPKAGRLLGNRDHTTIINSVKKHASAEPLAKIAYAAFCNAMARDEGKLRAEAIALHFEGAASVNSIIKRLAVSRIRVMGWLCDESERRRSEQRRAA